MYIISELLISLIYITNHGSTKTGNPLTNEDSLNHENVHPRIKVFIQNMNFILIVLPMFNVFYIGRLVQSS
jgi:hypothetical protein